MWQNTPWASRGFMRTAEWVVFLCPHTSCYTTPGDTSGHSLDSESELSPFLSLIKACGSP